MNSLVWSDREYIYIYIYILVCIVKHNYTLEQVILANGWLCVVQCTTHHHHHRCRSYLILLFLSLSHFLITAILCIHRQTSLPPPLLIVCSHSVQHSYTLVSECCSGERSTLHITQPFNIDKTAEPMFFNNNNCCLQ